MKILKEPLFYFLLIGLLIFIIDRNINGDLASEDEIVITKDDIRRISKLYRQNWNQAPDDETLEKLMDDYINSEIYYKEALKLQLDHNDEIIKRRLRQKYEFLAQDLADLVDPEEEELRSYYQEKPDNYISPRQISFRQFYINPDKHQDPLRHANSLKAHLSKGSLDKITTNGDNSHLDQVYERQDAQSVSRIFGEDFAIDIFADSSLGWYGPIQSGYGYHIVFIDEVIPDRLLEYNEVTEDVLEDWKNDNRLVLNQSLISGLRKNYKIIRRYEE